MGIPRLCASLIMRGTTHALILHCARLCLGLWALPRMDAYPLVLLTSLSNALSNDVEILHA